MSASDRLDHLLESRSDLWRGRGRVASDVLGTGNSQLDRRLPGGGWPCGQLIELVPELPGAGELGLLLPLMADLTCRKHPVVLAAPPMVPCPQALVAGGVHLEQLMVIRQAGQALWAAEQCLKSGLCGAVVVWPQTGRIQARAIRRLKLAAGHGSAPLFVCYRPGQQPPSSLATLRLAVRPGAIVEVLRAAGTTVNGGLHTGPDNILPFRSRTAS